MNDLKNIIILILSAAVIALICTLAFSSFKTKDNDLANSQNAINSIEQKNYEAKNVKNNRTIKPNVVADEPAYGSKEYFDALYSKQAKSDNENSVIKIDTKVAPRQYEPISQTTANKIKPAAPVAKALLTNKTPVAITGETKSGPVTRPVPVLSPSNNVSNNKSNNNPGIDALREPDFGPYMRQMQRNVKMNWNPPKGNESKRVVTKFQIGKNGQLLNSQIYKSSGNAEADLAALNAIQSTKYEPLPSSFNKQYIDVQFTFDYNVFSATRN